MSLCCAASTSCSRHIPFFVALDLTRLLLLVREAGFLRRNLVILWDVAGAARDLVLIKQIAIGQHGFRAPLEEARELIQLAGKGCAVRDVILRQHVLVLRS